MRLVFFGSPALSVPTLRALHTHGHDVVLVITQDDRPRGKRGKTVFSTPVKHEAQLLGIPVSHNLDDAIACGADLGVLVAYGRIIPARVLHALTIINLHPSLLPRWRGATPGEAAILHGDNETGISLMQLVAEMDAGPIYASETRALDDTITAEALYADLFAMGNTLLLRLLDDDLPMPQLQRGTPTYSAKRTKDEARIDWSRSAQEVSRLVRAGGAWTTFRGHRMLILSAEVEAAPSPLRNREHGAIDSNSVQCGDGSLRLDRVQIEGKNPIVASAWANGARIKPGERLE